MSESEAGERGSFRGSTGDRGTTVRGRGGGIAVALSRGVRLLVPLALSATLLPACITESIRIEPPANFPASIESTDTASHPLNRVISFVPTEAPDGGTTDYQPFDLDVVIRDPDVDQHLEYQLYVDARRGGGNTGGEIPTSTEGDRTRRTLSIPTGDALVDLRSAGCHRIEVLVSEGFRPGSPVPLVEGDLGTAVWWVATADMEGDPVEMSGCNP